MLSPPLLLLLRAVVWVFFCVAAVCGERRSAAERYCLGWRWGADGQMAMAMEERSGSEVCCRIVGAAKLQVPSGRVLQMKGWR